MLYSLLGGVRTVLRRRRSADGEQTLTYSAVAQLSGH
jgi:hypothetical protein